MIYAMLSRGVLVIVWIIHVGPIWAFRVQIRLNYGQLQAQPDAIGCRLCECC